MVSCVLFIAALAINIGVWALDFFVVKKTQQSFYYLAGYTVASSLDGTTYASSDLVVTDSHSTLSVAMGLVYSWLLWKLSLMVYSYHLISNSEGKILRIGTFIALAVVILGLDILLTIFAPFYWR